MAKRGTASRAHKAARAAARPSPGGFRRADLAAYLTLTPSGLDKLRARGEIPAPVMIGSMPFWPKHVVDEWLAAKAAV